MKIPNKVTFIEFYYISKVLCIHHQSSWRHKEIKYKA